MRTKKEILARIKKVEAKIQEIIKQARGEEVTKKYEVTPLDLVLLDRELWTLKWVLGPPSKPKKLKGK